MDTHKIIINDSINPANIKISKLEKQIFNKIHDKIKDNFKEDKENYYGADRKYAAIRVPQVDINVNLKNRILSGQVKQSDAFRLERECLEALNLFDKHKFQRAALIELLIEYQSLFGGTRNYAAEYEVTLRDRPWKDCKCTVCEELGINVLIFRGAERNRRRGFHNVFVTYNRLKKIRSRIAVA